MYVLKMTSRNKCVALKKTECDEKYCQIEGDELSELLGITKQAVYNSLKRSLKKIYKYLKARNPILESSELIVIMSEMFGMNNSCKELKKFFGLFPVEVKREVYSNLREKIPYNKEISYEYQKRENIKTMC